MNDKYTTILWSVVTICFTTLLVSCLMYNADKNKLGANAITHGADPIKVACAMKIQDNGVTTADVAICGLGK